MSIDIPVGSFQKYFQGVQPKNRKKINWSLVVRKINGLINSSYAQHEKSYLAGPEIDISWIYPWSRTKSYFRQL